MAWQSAKTGDVRFLHWGVWYDFTTQVNLHLLTLFYHVINNMALYKQTSGIARNVVCCLSTVHYSHHVSVYDTTWHLAYIPRQNRICFSTRRQIEVLVTQEHNSTKHRWQHKPSAICRNRDFNESPQNGPKMIHIQLQPLVQLFKYQYLSVGCFNLLLSNSQRCLRDCINKTEHLNSFVECRHNGEWGT